MSLAMQWDYEPVIYRKTKSELSFGFRRSSLAPITPRSELQVCAHLIRKLLKHKVKMALSLINDCSDQNLVCVHSFVGVVMWLTEVKNINSQGT